VQSAIRTLVRSTFLLFSLPSSWIPGHSPSFLDALHRTFLDTWTSQQHEDSFSFTMLHLQHNTTRTPQDTSKRLLLPRRLLPLPLTKLLASTESSSSLELPPQSEQRPSQTLLHGNTTAEFVAIPLPLRHNSTATTRRRSTKTRLLPRLSRSRALSSTHLDPATIWSKSTPSICSIHTWTRKYISTTSLPYGLDLQRFWNKSTPSICSIHIWTRKYFSTTSLPYGLDLDFSLYYSVYLLTFPSCHCIQERRKRY
jgi:hypothetical protein